MFDCVHCLIRNVDHWRWSKKDSYKWDHIKIYLLAPLPQGPCPTLHRFHQLSDSKESVKREWKMHKPSSLYMILLLSSSLTRFGNITMLSHITDFSLYRYFSPIFDFLGVKKVFYSPILFRERIKWSIQLFWIYYRGIHKKPIYTQWLIK